METLFRPNRRLKASPEISRSGTSISPRMTVAISPSVRPRTRFAALPALAVMFLVGAAAAQTQAPSGTPAPAQKPTLDDVRQRDRELESVRAEQKKAVDTQKKLQEEIDAIGADRRTLNQALIDAAAGIRSDEARVAEAEGRLKQLTDGEADIRKSLTARRAVIAEVLAALQRVGRRPPPAMLMRPEDALESVRAAMLLGAVVPEMREEAEALAGQLNQLVHVRAQAAAERDGLSRELAGLAEQKLRMTLLVEQRQKRQGEAEKELDSERQ
ncbi:MAG TPA: hypothetical protein VLX44_03540, partial [Xanthobacteraceae bacterium]|nr:hypothetical protein [Xanthobacteraceae bacterium]